MRHIEDITYKGHEIVICFDEGEGEIERGYVVDVRSDDYDGEMLAGYTGITHRDDAMQIGQAYVDGMRRIINRVQRVLDQELKHKD